MVAINFLVLAVLLNPLLISATAIAGQDAGLINRRATECREDCITRCNSKSNASEKATCLTACASKSPCASASPAKTSPATSPAKTSPATSPKTSPPTSPKASPTTTTKTSPAASPVTQSPGAVTFPPANPGCGGKDYNGALGSPGCYAVKSPKCSDKGVTAPAGLPSAFPAAEGRLSCDAPFLIANNTVFDGKALNGGKLMRYDRGPGLRAYYGADCLTVEPGEESVVFVLHNGATLKNVIIGKEVGDAVYCYGDCTIENVYWEQVCEDGLSVKYAGPSPKVVVKNSMFFGHKDKVIQHNSGGSVTVNNVDIWYSGSGKFYRSCGDCPKPDSYDGRKFIGSSIRIHGTKGADFVRINGGRSDTATLTDIHVPSAFGVDKWSVCNDSNGNKFSSAGDGKSCIYKSGDVLWDSTA